MTEPIIDPAFLARHTQILCASYSRWTGFPLVNATLHSTEAIQQLLNAPFAVASHGTEVDPVFNYANKQAQQLFGMTWDEITSLPSRYSAMEMDRVERSRMLERVAKNGFVDDYSGVRIGKYGTRFTINKATVWSLLDEKGDYYGQAVLIRDWSA